MRKYVVYLTIALASLGAVAAEPSDFSGIWNFDASQSKNVGMMSMASITVTIKQDGSRLSEDDHSEFGKKAADDHFTYDLTGKPVDNVTGMSGSGTTTSKWTDGRLVTTWKAAGKVERVETRYLSADGKTMIIESQNEGQPTLVMAYVRAK